jgi:hypothetical protein
MVPLARTDSPTHTLAKVASGRLGTKNLVVAVTSTVLDVVDRALATTKDPDVPPTPHVVAFAVPLTAVTTPVTGGPATGPEGRSTVRCSATACDRCEDDVDAPAAAAPPPTTATLTATAQDNHLLTERPRAAMCTAPFSS